MTIQQLAARLPCPDSGSDAPVAASLELWETASIWSQWRGTTLAHKQLHEMEQVHIFHAQRFLPVSPVLPFPGINPHVCVGGNFDLDVFKRFIALLSGANMV